MKSQRLLISLLTIASIAVALPILHKYYVAQQDQKAKQAQLLLPEAQKYNIIFTSIPKSGAGYIRTALANGLRYSNVNIASGYFPFDTVIYDNLFAFYQRKNLITQDHLDPSEVNFQVLKLFTDKMVIHMRDPREVLLSWTHFTNTLNAREYKHGLYHLVPYPPAEYFNWTLEQQIDWNIDHHLANIVNWMQGWLAYKEQQDADPNGLKILLTTYDEFVRDQKAFYNKILTFYEIPKARFYFNKPVKNEIVHFRKGDSNEWRHVFTAEQQARIAAQLPPELLQRFGWK